MRKNMHRGIMFAIAAVLFVNIFISVNASGDVKLDVSWDGKSEWETISKSKHITLNDIAFGDFNGDGNDDVFYADGSAWYVRYSGQGSWEKLETSHHTIEYLRFGDFNGDGITDVFLNTYNAWKVSWGGKTKWEIIETEDLVHNYWIDFGDFDGDGITDVFFGSGPDAWDDVCPFSYFYPHKRTWYIRYSAVGEWKIIDKSNYTAKELKFADFDGDGITDVFLNLKNSWNVKWGGRTLWETFETRDLVHYNNHLAIGDFNNDGCDDFFYGDREVWRVRYSGQGEWDTLRPSEYMVENLGFGDFNGDGITDVFHIELDYQILSLTIDPEPISSEEEPINPESEPEVEPEPVPEPEPMPNSFPSEEGLEILPNSNPLHEPMPLTFPIEEILKEPELEPEIQPEPETEPDSTLTDEPLSTPKSSTIPETVEQQETSSVFLPIILVTVGIISLISVVLLVSKIVVK